MIINILDMILQEAYVLVGYKIFCFALSTLVDSDVIQATKSAPQRQQAREDRHPRKQRSRVGCSIFASATPRLTHHGICLRTDVPELLSGNTRIWKGGIHLHDNIDTDVPLGRVLDCKTQPHHTILDWQ